MTTEYVAKKLIEYYALLRKQNMCSFPYFLELENKKIKINERN